MSIFTAEFCDKFDAEFASDKLTKTEEGYPGILYAEHIKQFKTDKRKDDFMYKKKEKKPTKIIVVPHFIGTEKDTKIFKKIVEEKVRKKLKEINKTA